MIYNDAGDKALLYIILILSFYAILAALRNATYKEEAILWLDTTDKSSLKARPHLNLGVIYRINGLLDEAEKEYGKALSIGSSGNYTGYVAYNNLGVIYAKRGMMDEAELIFRRLVEQYPTLYMAYPNLGVLYMEKGMTNEGINILKKGIELEPENPTAYYYIGLIYLKEQKLEEAQEAFNKVLEIDSLNGLAHSKKGQVYMAKGLLEETMSEFQKALELGVNDSAIHQNMATLYGKKRLWSEAVKEYRMALLQKPTNCNALYGIALSLDKSGNDKEALSSYNDFLKICDNPQHDAMIKQAKYRAAEIEAYQ